VVGTVTQGPIDGRQRLRVWLDFCEYLVGFSRLAGSEKGYRPLQLGHSRVYFRTAGISSRQFRCAQHPKGFLIVAVSILGHALS
jgi:hypothetical protein